MFAGVKFFFSFCIIDNFKASIHINTGCFDWISLLTTEEKNFSN